MENDQNYSSTSDNSENNLKNHQRPSGEREENAFSQSEDYEDENGAGGNLGRTGESDADQSRYDNDSPGGAGSTGSAATNDGEELT